MVDFLNWRPTKLKIVRTKTTGWLKIDGSHHCFVQPLAPPDLEPLNQRISALEDLRRKLQALDARVSSLPTKIDDEGRPMPLSSWRDDDVLAAACPCSQSVELTVRQVRQWLASGRRVVLYRPEPSNVVGTT